MTNNQFRFLVIGVWDFFRIIRTIGLIRIIYGANFENTAIPSTLANTFLPEIFFARPQFLVQVVFF